MQVENVIKEINRGGFGIIEEVICDDGRHYARKTFDPLTNPKITSEIINKCKNRFIREVSIQSRLQQEYIIPIIYYNLTDDKPWYLMPVADYDYNHEIIFSKSEDRKPEGLSDILNSLEYLHNLGYVHRDLKPGNILYHDGFWKLSDLGLITPDKEITALSITSSNDWSGTEMYMAPEQITNFRYVDNRADIYSFGAILHDIYGKNSRTPYSNLSCTGEMNVIIDKCTKKEPKQRFKSVENLRDKLLYLLSKDSKSIASTLQHQIDKFADIDSFDSAKLEDLIFYLKEDNSDVSGIFYELNNTIVNHIYEIDVDLFIEFSLFYIDWVKNSSFSFDYCDVIIHIINNIYKKTKNIDLKSKCVISAAQLGKSHNRWYVMDNVIKMANTDIDEILAIRLQIEIETEEQNKINFNRCIDELDKQKNSYHHLIAKVL
ncbi:protein kinase [Elizabethkingia anophelis]|uniref:protein kinase domain-containing protein n=1 Tax=Elizabethkingia anophelis TaxID=1117645 RepID=UPI0006665258|nr:protein kinase [Elizabethkingia anophelis]MCT3728310.1 protein kinase [Elizabethkingia anophelis]